MHKPKTRSQSWHILSWKASRGLPPKLPLLLQTAMSCSVSRCLLPWLSMAAYMLLSYWLAGNRAPSCYAGRRKKKPDGPGTEPKQQPSCRQRWRQALRLARQLGLERPSAQAGPWAGRTAPAARRGGRSPRTSEPAQRSPRGSEGRTAPRPCSTTNSAAGASVLSAEEAASPWLCQHPAQRWCKPDCSRALSETALCCIHNPARKRLTRRHTSPRCRRTRRRRRCTGLRRRCTRLQARERSGTTVSHRSVPRWQPAGRSARRSPP